LLLNEIPGESTKVRMNEVLINENTAWGFCGFGLNRITWKVNE
jgi:hypothetical protein